MESQEKGCSTCSSGEAAETEIAETQAKAGSSLGSPVTFRVSGMDCSDEVNAIKRALQVDGISAVEANLMSSTIKVSFNPPASLNLVREKINATGVKVIDDPDHDAGPVTKGRIYLVVASGAAVAAAMALDFFTGNKTLTLIAAAVAVLTGGVLIFPKAWRALRGFQLDMNVLMTVAALGAFLIGECSEAATVVFLFSLSELLEAFSVARARRAIREVLNLTPEVAAKVGADGSVTSVPVAEVKLGDVIRVRPGERVALDGIVSKGSSSVNQAPLTGESVPVEKKSGDQVYAGTINENGVLEFKVSALAADSKVAKVISLIESAQGAKAPSERFVDRFAKIYTPVVFIGALLALLVPPLLFSQSWEVWIYRSLVLLVVACPCALVLATPVSIVSGLTAMARRGVLVKGGIYLEALARLRALAVDKTGTITEGVPKVQKVILTSSLGEQQLLEIASSIETSSTHPLARAVITYAEEKKTPKIAHDNFRNVVGRGAEAEIAGVKYFLGNHRFAHELGACTPEIERRIAELEQEALSIIIVGRASGGGANAETLGILGLGDAVRPGAAEAIRALHAAGIEEVIMLSGDNQKTASAIAAKVGIDRAVGDLLPEAKVEQIKALLKKRGSVGMIGDGINDAPALALASVGIAMGAAGTDTAIETADVALMRDDLSQVAVAVIQGKRALRVIQFNIGFAIAIKAVFLVLAVLGYTNLWFAVLADTGASLLVIANALRLLRI